MNTLYTLIIVIAGSTINDQNGPAGASAVSTSLVSQVIGVFNGMEACKNAGKDLFWSKFSDAKAPNNSSVGYVCVQAPPPATH